MNNQLVENANRFMVEQKIDTIKKVISILGNRPSEEAVKELVTTNFDLDDEYDANVVADIMGYYKLDYEELFGVVDEATLGEGEDWNYLSNELASPGLANVIYNAELVKEIVSDSRMSKDFIEQWKKKGGNYKGKPFSDFIDKYEEEFANVIQMMRRYDKASQQDNIESRPDPREGSGAGNRSRSA